MPYVMQPDRRQAEPADVGVERGAKLIRVKRLPAPAAEHEIMVRPDTGGDVLLALALTVLPQGAKIAAPS